MTRLQVAALIAVVALVWVAHLYFSGVPVSSGFLNPFSTAVTVVFFLLLSFEKWIWKWNLLHPWFVSVPDIHGTWKGTLVSNWRIPQSVEALPPIDVFLVVRQTYSSVDLRLLTEQSSSELLAGKLVADGVGMYVLVGAYRNTPRLLSRDGSPIHHGAVLLAVNGNPPASLSGEYWTDRTTKGEVAFDARSKQLAYDYLNARKQAYNRS